MRLHLLLILLLVGFSFGSDANYIISLKGSPNAKALSHAHTQSAIAPAAPKGRAAEIQAIQASTLDSQKDIVQELKSMGVEVKHQFWLTNGLAVYVPPEKLSELESLPEVERISPNGKVFLLRQNAGPVIGLPSAWNLGLNGSGLKIAIVDTGVNKTHPELVGRVINETDFHDDSYDGLNPADFDGHGTHVAGIAAGSLYGVARNVSILNAKVFYCPYPGGCTPTQWTATTGDVIAAINWAVAQGAKVISMSLGTNDVCDINDSLAPTVEATVTMGIPVVVAAGNSGGSGTIASPGCSKGAITVGATDNSDNIASYSSRGPTQDGRIKPDLTAPGGIFGIQINSTSKDGGYTFMRGTSMATPFVSGTVILLLEKKPSLKPQMLKAVLMNSAKNLSALPDNTYGAGRLNISEAIRQTDMVLQDNASSSQNKTYFIYVSNSNAPLKTTLYWSEAWNAHSNLNLTLISPNGSVFSNYNNDVFEQVSVSQPQRGQWQLVVSSDTNRSFALAFSQNSTFNSSIFPQAQNVTLNSTANFTVFIDSVAGFNDSFIVTASVFAYYLSNSPVNVSANSSANVTLSVLIPANATAGNYPFMVSVLSNATNRTSDAMIAVNIFSNMSLSLLPMNTSFRGSNLTIQVNATNPNLNITVINPSLAAYLQSPSGANYAQSFSYSGGLHVGSFPIPLNASVGVWNITVNSTNPFYNTAPVNSTVTVFGRINATIITNQSMIAGNAYSVNSTIFEDAGNPVSANVSWYLNGTNIANGTGFLFLPLEAEVGNRTLSINATKQYYSDGLYSINLTILNPPPTITNLTILPSHLLLPNETMNVSALVTDNLNVSSVWANITFPNASSGIFFLNGSGSYSTLLNFSANGTYSLNLFANDSLNNSANQSGQFSIFPPVNISFNLNATGVLRILPQNYNETRNSTNASASMRLPSAEYRLRLELGNDSVQFNNVPLTLDAAINLSAQPKNISDNEVFLPVNAYELSTSANFSSARVSFAYNSTVDSGKLSIFHCTDANYRNCTPVSTSIDAANRLAYADVQNFSIYTLGLNKTFSAGIFTSPLSVKSGDSVYITVNVTLDGAPVSDANFSVSVGGTAISITNKAFANGMWTLSFTVPSLSDGAQTLLAVVSYGARSAWDSRIVTYYTPAQQTTTFSPGGYYSATTYKNASNATASNRTAQNKTEEELISLEITELEENLSLYTGSEKVIPISVFNSGGREFVTVSLSGIDPSLFFSDSGFVNSSETKKFNVLLKIPLGTEAGNYTIYVNALVGGKVQASRAFLLEILEKPANATKNESRIIAKVSTLTKTVRGELPVIQLDLITGKPELVIVNYLVKNAETGEVVSNYSEPFFLEKSSTISKKINVPKNLTAGIYVIEAVFAYNGKTAKDITTFEALPAEPQKAPLQIPYLQIAGLLLFAVIALAAAHSFRKKPVQKKREEKLFLDAKEVPKAGLYLGKIKSTPTKAYLRLNDLLLHAIAAGGTGSGKTVAVMDIVEEALDEGVKVVVFDPTAQWTGFPKLAGVEMLGRYAEFGISGKDKKGYPANIIDASGPEVPLDLKSLPDGLTVFDMHNLKVRDLDKFIENSISSIFASSLPESKSLKYLIIYDEIHRSLPKYGGKKSYVALERGCREFRKWGIGLIMISQVLSDFRGAIRANIGTEIQMRTKYEADIGRMKSKYGAEYARQLTRLRIGEGILQNPEYNSGKAFLVQFRPLRHSESRATEEELKKYQQITERADALEAKAAKMKAKKPYGMEEEIALAREKARLFAFRMAETYLDSVEEKINSIQKD